MMKFALLTWCALVVTMQAQQSVVDLKATEFAGGEKTADGIKFTLQLPAKRSNWTSCDWKTSKLPDSVKLAGHAIRIKVKTDKPRHDAGVYIALGEADGSWYCHPWAAGLNQSENSGLARLEDFSPCEWTSPGSGKFNDENGQLDPDQVTQIAIGSINPLGVGTLEFTLTDLSLVKAETKPAPPVQVDVTGQLLDVNGTKFVPAGVFGSFNLKEGTYEGRTGARTELYRLASDRMILGGGSGGGSPVTHQVIQVVGGDRGSASPRLSNPNWKSDAIALGTRMGETAKSTGKPVYAEYYNEPYLNWANKNRRSFHPSHFDESKAAEGGPVHIKHDGMVAPFLKWTKNYDAPLWNWCSRIDWRRGKDAAGKVYSDFAEPTPWGRRNSAWLPASHPPLNVKDGETYTVKLGKKGQEQEVTLTAFTPWHIYDETQFTYWSSKGLAMFYNDPAVAFGKAFKAAGGDKAVYIIGWGNRPSEDHWAGFYNLYKDTIDQTVSFIDGVNDHDYGGDPVKMSANYEVICAYGMTAHNKWLYGYNTECSGSFDPEAYGTAAGTGSPELAGASWIAAKIMHALDYVPDKARNFAHFGGGNFFRDGGEGVALTALMNLRGRLLQVKHEDPDVYIAAAVDGTDPQNPRPAKMGDTKELVVAAFNAAPTPREINLKVAAPKGATLGAPVVNILKSDAGKPVIAKAQAGPVTLAPREMLVATYPLTGEIADAKPVTREQTFAKVVLQNVTPAASVKTQVDAKLPATRAWIQFVAERLGEGEATLTLNGTAIPLPKCVSPENTPWMRRLPVDPKLLKATNDLTVEIADKAQAGFLLGSLSLIVERE